MKHIKLANAILNAAKRIGPGGAGILGTSGYVGSRVGRWSNPNWKKYWDATSPETVKKYSLGNVQDQIPAYEAKRLKDLQESMRFGAPKAYNEEHLRSMPSLSREEYLQYKELKAPIQYTPGPGFNFSGFVEKLHE